MVAAFVLIAGVLLTMLVAAVAFAWAGSLDMLMFVLPWSPLVIAVGTFLLMLPELLLLFGRREDRKAALRDFAYLFPTFIVSGGLFLLAWHYLW